MEPNEIFLVTILAALIIMVIASVYVVKDKYLNKRQKLFQLILIFSLPFLGALVAWTINQIMEQDNVKENEAAGSQPDNNNKVTPIESNGGKGD